MKAFDTFEGKLLGKPKLTAIVSDGFKAVGYYYFKESGFKHLLNAAAAKAISKAGLKIFSVYENGKPDHAGYFSTTKGNMDAHVAHVRLTDAGQPTGTPVFFAVDYDAETADLAAIKDYFDEIQRVFGVMGDTHTLGVYSSGRVCKFLKDAGLVSFTWLSQSTGFAGHSSWLPHADIVQGPVKKIRAMDCDNDDVVNEAVLWSVPTP